MTIALPYREQMALIRSKYGDQTFSEFEKANHITAYSYEEVGYGYRMKDTQPMDMIEATDDLTATPLLDEIEALADQLGH